MKKSVLSLRSNSRYFILLNLSSGQLIQHNNLIASFTKYYSSSIYRTQVYIIKIQTEGKSAHCTSQVSGSAMVHTSRLVPKMYILPPKILSVLQKLWFIAPSVFGSSVIYHSIFDIEFYSHKIGCFIHHSKFNIHHSKSPAVLWKLQLDTGPLRLDTATAHRDFLCYWPFLYGANYFCFSIISVVAPVWIFIPISGALPLSTIIIALQAKTGCSIHNSSSIIRDPRLFSGYCDWILRLFPAAPFDIWYSLLDIRYFFFWLLLDILFHIGLHLHIKSSPKALIRHNESTKIILIHSECE